MAITQDGAINEVAWSSSNKLSTNALSCSSSGNIIFVAVEVTDGATVTDVEDESANAFTLIKNYATYPQSLWARYYSGTFNSKIRVKVNFTPGFGAFHAFGINGFQSATVDANAGSTASGGSSPISVSSNGTAGIIVATARSASSTPTEASGWNKAIDTSGAYMVAQWKEFSGGALSSYSVSIGTGDAGVNGFVAAVFTDIVSGGSTSLGGSASTSATGTQSPGFSIAL